VLSLENRFDLDQEANIPTWYSTVLLFSISQLSLIIYIIGRKIRLNASLRSFWLGFSAVYCFLSLDEAARLHSMITFGVNVKWIFVYAPLGALFFSFCLYYFITIIRLKI